MRAGAQAAATAAILAYLVPEVISRSPFSYSPPTPPWLAQAENFDGPTRGRGVLARAPVAPLIHSLQGVGALGRGRRACRLLQRLPCCVAPPRLPLLQGGDAPPLHTLQGGPALPPTWRSARLPTSPPVVQLLLSCYNDGGTSSRLPQAPQVPGLD
ncbi:hypothetical protein PVAP13_5KG374800 [Panicum virgatum]|uniref:Uncharacterized protein n=1 Tax=Panicum virgatum TaxID=38727 RepID=A0A8T0SP33_PANVG|nr:hypothetical protein PVAP13_5KG374800 [Panicum virgatum]